MPWFLGPDTDRIQLWPKFQDTLSANPKLFAVIQGVAAPTVTSMFYLILPAIMRKISIWAGFVVPTPRMQVEQVADPSQ